jgi:hypothetical protein
VHASGFWLDPFQLKHGIYAYPGLIVLTRDRLGCYHVSMASSRRSRHFCEHNFFIAGSGQVDPAASSPLSQARIIALANVCSGTVRWSADVRSR